MQQRETWIKYLLSGWNSCSPHSSICSASPGISAQQIRQQLIATACCSTQTFREELNTDENMARFKSLCFPFPWNPAGGCTVLQLTLPNHRGRNIHSAPRKCPSARLTLFHSWLYTITAEQRTNTNTLAPRDPGTTKNWCDCTKIEKKLTWNTWNFALLNFPSLGNHLTNKATTQLNLLPETVTKNEFFLFFFLSRTRMCV